MSARPDDKQERPDDLSPEWAEYESRWAVDVAAFGGPVEASRFLIRRKRIFRAAEQAGMTREMLEAFEPSKPGFEARIREAFAAVARSAGLAAE